jgi:thioredoxin 1
MKDTVSMSAVVELTEANFAETTREGLALVDFWAPWCGPCKNLGPIVEELANDYQGRVAVCKVNTDDNIALAQQFRISSIPCLILFKNGEAVDQMVGVHAKANLAAMLDKHL